MIKSIDIEFDEKGDYIQCVSCCESIMWGDIMIHYGDDQFYHDKCWSEECKRYYDGN